MSDSEAEKAKDPPHTARSTTVEFWRGYRVERVGETVYLANEAGTEAFTIDQAEAYALAIIAEIHGDDDE